MNAHGAFRAPAHAENFQQSKTKANELNLKSKQIIQQEEETTTEKHTAISIAKTKAKNIKFKFNQHIGGVNNKLIHSIKNWKTKIRYNKPVQHSCHIGLVLT